MNGLRVTIKNRQGPWRQRDMRGMMMNDPDSFGFVQTWRWVHTPTSDTSNNISLVIVRALP